MLTRTTIRYFTAFVFFIMLFPLVIGCSARHQPKAWLSVEKKPLRVIYIDYHKDITPATTQMVMREASRFKFHDTDMNPTPSVVIDYDADVHGSYTNSTSLEVK